MPAGVIAREAEVFAGALTFDPSVADAAAVQTKWAQLAAVDIVVCEEDDPARRAATNARQTLGY